MYSRIQNPDAQKVVLLLHGWMHSSARWISLMRYLRSKDYHIVAPDFPGFGYSAIVENPSMLSMEYLINSTSELISSIQKTKPVYAVVAHSMGGLIALACLKTNNQFTQHLFLCDVPTNANGYLKLVRKIGPLFVLGLKLNQKLPIFLSNMFIKVASLPTVQRYNQVDNIIIDDALKADPIAAANLFDEIGNYSILNHDIPSLPLSIVSRGQHDKIVTREDGLALSNLLQTRYMEFKGTSHTPQLEDEAQFNRSVSNYLYCPSPYIKKLI